MKVPQGLPMFYKCFTISTLITILSKHLWNTNFENRDIISIYNVQITKCCLLRRKINLFERIKYKGRFLIVYPVLYRTQTVIRTWFIPTYKWYTYKRYYLRCNNNNNNCKPVGWQFISGFFISEGLAFSIKRYSLYNLYNLFL